MRPAGVADTPGRPQVTKPLLPGSELPVLFVRTVLDFECVCDNSEVPHHLIAKLAIKPIPVDRNLHALKPRIPLFRPDLNVPMHFADIRMSMLLDVELWPAKESGQKIELLLSRMRNAHPAQVEDIQEITFRLKLDDVVEGLDELAQSWCTTHPFVNTI
jgi:hypothetical protein